MTGPGGGNYKGDERRVDRVGKNRREEERVPFDKTRGVDDENNNNKGKIKWQEKGKRIN